MDLYLIPGNYLLGRLHHSAPENKLLTFTHYLQKNNKKNKVFLYMYRKMQELQIKSFHCKKPWRSSAQTGLSPLFMFTFRSKTASRSFFCSAPRSSASCLHLNVRPAQIPSHNHRPWLTGTACSTPGVHLYFAVPVPVAAVVQLPFPPSGACTNREMGRRCPWFSKRRDLLMPSFSCISVNQSFLLYCTVQTNFRTTFTWTYISILIIFDFIRRMSLCALCSLRRQVRDQAGAGKDSVSCSKTLEQTGWLLLWASSPAILPCNPNTDSWYEFQRVCVTLNIFILHFCSWIF